MFLFVSSDWRTPSELNCIVATHGVRVKVATHGVRVKIYDDKCPEGQWVAASRLKTLNDTMNNNDDAKNNSLDSSRTLGGAERVVARRSAAAAVAVAAQRLSFDSRGTVSCAVATTGKPANGDSAKTLSRRVTLHLTTVVVMTCTVFQPVIVAINQQKNTGLPSFSCPVSLHSNIWE